MSQKMLSIVLGVAVLAGGAWYFLAASKEQREEARRKALSAAYDAKGAVKRVVPKASVDFKDPKAAAQCRENIKRIASAKRAAAEKLGRAVGEIPLDAILKEMDLKSLPKCPAGGDYIIGTMDKMVRCNIGANGTTDPQDDHVVSGY